MGQKKRNVARKSKVSEEHGKPKVSDSSSPRAVDPAESRNFYPEIKVEFEKALIALRRGNHTKALRLMKDLCLREEISTYSALVYRVQGTICVKVASIMDDPHVKQRYLKSAVDSARKAVSLSPNSIEFSHFYANLLYEMASEAKEYEEVVQECERALSVEFPVDPAKESLQDESQQKIQTADGRIAHVQQELRALIQKSSIASLSTWMNNLGNGEERFRLLPLRRPMEDPMELKVAQVKRPNEIKKATKTIEERTKEIEVRVAAARLLQQKSVPLQSQKGHVQPEETSSVGSNKVAERKKSVSSRKSSSSSEGHPWVFSYWKSLNTEMKKTFLRIEVNDIKAQISSTKDNTHKKLLMEALSFAESNRSWKVWICCRCSESFSISEAHIQHVVHKHMGNLLPKMQSILPHNPDDDWTEMLLSCAWKPLDVSAAAKVLEKKFNYEDSEHIDELEFDRNSKFKNNYEGISVDSCDNKGVFRNSDTISSSKPNKVGHCYSKEKLITYSWTISDDSECAELLQGIGSIFVNLIRNKYLASDHLNKVIQLTRNMLNGLACGSLLLEHGLDQTPLSICFLAAPHLRKVLTYLQAVSVSSGLGKYSTKTCSPAQCDVVSTGDSNVKEILSLNGDASYLILDESFLYGNPATLSCDRDITDIGVPVGHSFVSWIFSGATINEEIASWMRTKEEKACRGLEILQILEKEFYQLERICERKCDHVSYDGALDSLGDLFLKEKLRNDITMELENKSFEYCLRKRKEDLERENDALDLSFSFELDALRNILKEAEDIKSNQLESEEPFSAVASRLHNLELEEDGGRNNDREHQLDACIEVAIERQKDRLSLELAKIDARIMRTVTGMQQLELDLEPVSVHDYELIGLSLAKSLIRARLEQMAEKDATEKSDAAREAFLAELALDSKKNSPGEYDTARHVHEKVKEKKKNKEFRRKKDSKARVHDETAKQVSPRDSLDLETVSSPDEEEQKRKEQELRRISELEAEERMLEETLEYQRRIENEAKQKHLAEQLRQTARTTPSERAAESLQDLLKSPEDDNELHRKQLNHEKQESNNSGTTDFGLQNGSVVEDDCKKIYNIHTQKFHHANGIDLANGEISDAVLLDSDPHGPERYKEISSLSEKHPNVSCNGGDFYVSGNEAGLKADNGNSSQENEEEGDERFQMDLKKAMSQSLVDDFGSSMNGAMTQTFDSSEVFGTGLKNEAGEYNCFLNVVIQSLWHLKRFRQEFKRRIMLDHLHVGDPCVVCALHDIFDALSIASSYVQREAVDPTSLRTALSNLYPHSNFFKEAQMNDASEVLGVIFECLHQSFTSGVSDAESVESNCLRSWDCADGSCVAHALFGMDVFERMNCYNCGLESRHLKYTSFFHNINASALRTMKDMSSESSFDELLNLVEMNHQLACDPEFGGCGKLNHIHHILSSSPDLFTIVVGWQNTCESLDDIMTTLYSLGTEIDLSILYRGLDPKDTHLLVSMVCYYGQHYCCFAYNSDHEKWVFYDDKTVKVIGWWGDVLVMCERGHLQPQVLFYESRRI